MTSPTDIVGQNRERGNGTPAVRAANWPPLSALSKVSDVIVPECPTATCRPRNTGNHEFWIDTRSIGQLASMKANWRFPAPFPQRHSMPMVTKFGVPKFPHTTMKSGLVAVGGFWQLP